MKTMPIYLDAQGTEKIRPEALSTMNFYFAEGFGNPSATARAGRLYLNFIVFFLKSH